MVKQMTPLKVRKKFFLLNQPFVSNTYSKEREKKLIKDYRITYVE